MSGWSDRNDPNRRSNNGSSRNAEGGANGGDNGADGGNNSGDDWWKSALAGTAAAVAGGLLAYGIGKAIFGGGGEEDAQPSREQRHQQQPQQYHEGGEVKEAPKKNWRMAEGRNSANSVLKDVFAKHISIDDDHRNKMVAILKSFVEMALIDQMTALSPLFKIIYRHIYHTGSYYSGLRVGDAREFDLNVVLNIPLAPDSISVEDKKADQGFVRIAVNEGYYMPPNHPLFPHRVKYFETFTKNGYFDAEKMKCWMESLVVRSVDLTVHRQRDFGITRILVRKSGPAMTLSIDALDGHMDVDLVPSLVRKIAELRNHNRIFERIQIYGGEFFVIPKRSKKDAANSERLWRLSFPNQESTLIYHKQCVKPVIKLLKTFRDRNAEGAGMQKVSSYALTSVVMFMLEDSANSQLWHSETNLAELFLRALDKLHGFLGRGRIPHIFDFQCNLLWDTNPATITIMVDRLAKILKELKESRDGPNCRQIWLKYL